MMEFSVEDFGRRQATKELFEAHEIEIGNGTSKLTRLFVAAGVIALLLIGTLAAAYAQGKTPPISVAQSLSLLQAMRALDGRIAIVKQNGVDVAVSQPWEFASGALRLRIAKNTTALAEVEKALEDTRQAIVRELLKSVPADADGKPAVAIPQGSPQWEDLQRQFGEALNAPSPVLLMRIKASELKLDRNEIPGTALSAMAPILDDDVSPK